VKIPTAPKLAMLKPQTGRLTAASMGSMQPLATSKLKKKKLRLIKLPTQSQQISIKASPSKPTKLSHKKAPTLKQQLIVPVMMKKTVSEQHPSDML